MSTDAACTYCGCDVRRHDPVSVYERGERTEGKEGRDVPGEGDPFDGIDRTLAGQFCNYGCLVAHVEAAGLAEGATCRSG